MTERLDYCFSSRLAGLVREDDSDLLLFSILLDYIGVKRGSDDKAR